MKVRPNGTFVIPNILTINPHTHPKAHIAIANKPADVPMARFILDMMENGIDASRLGQQPVKEIDMHGLAEEI